MISRLAAALLSLGLLAALIAPEAQAKRVRARIDGTTFELKIPNRPPKGFKPGRLSADLKTLIATIETHFGKRLVITSGCRSPERNREVGGAPRSFHLTCDAVDFVIPGVSKQAIRDFALAIPGRGGVGTYCHLDIVHIDVGPRRQWHWPCRTLPPPTDPARAAEE